MGNHHAKNKAYACLKGIADIGLINLGSLTAEELHFPGGKASISSSGGSPDMETVTIVW